MFTKRHYVEIANILATSRTKKQIANKLARFFENDNPRFDTARWLEAANKKEDE